MSTVNKLIYRLRLKLKDTTSITYSKYEILEALSEAMDELTGTVTQFYDHLNFMIPEEEDDLDDLPLNDGESIIELDSSGVIEEEDETGWPSDFDGLIIEYALIVLSPGDYMPKEQAKLLWKQKVISITSTFNTETSFIKGYYRGGNHG